MLGLKLTRVSKKDPNGSFYQHGLPLIPIWMLVKCGMKLLIRSQTSTAALLKIGNG